MIVYLLLIACYQECSLVDAYNFNRGVLIKEAVYRLYFHFLSANLGLSDEGQAGIGDSCISNGNTTFCLVVGRRIYLLFQRYSF